MPAERALPRGATRRLPRALLWAAGLLLAGRIAAEGWDGLHAPAERDLVHWTEPGLAAREARTARRPVLYDFTAAWCPPCRRMKKEVFGDQLQSDYLNANFVCVRVLDRTREDGKNTPEIEALQRRFRIEAFPTIVIARGDGRLVDAQRGYGGVESTRSFLAEALRKASGAKQK